jgi:hypothetical protein
VWGSKGVSCLPGVWVSILRGMVHWWLQIAKRQAVVNPENTFASVKRFIGRKMNEVKEESKQVPYKVRLLLLCYWVC